MVFKSPYSLTLPNIDYLNYLFSATVFKPTDKVWIEATTPLNYITQARALELTQRIGAGLQSLGVSRPWSVRNERDIVLLCSENQVMTPVTMFGIINSGGVVCTCPPQATSMEIARQIESCRPKVVICSPAILEVAQEGVKGSILKDLPIAVMSSADGKQELKLLDGTSLVSDKKLDLEKITDPDVLSKRVCFLGYSSGTTGVPKGNPPRACNRSDDFRSPIDTPQHNRPTLSMGNPLPPFPPKPKTKGPANLRPRGPSNLPCWRHHGTHLPPPPRWPATIHASTLQSRPNARGHRAQPINLYIPFSPGIPVVHATRVSEREDQERVVCDEWGCTVE